MQHGETPSGKRPLGGAHEKRSLTPATPEAYVPAGPVTKRGTRSEDRRLSTRPHYEVYAPPGSQATTPKALKGTAPSLRNSRAAAPVVSMPTIVWPGSNAPPSWSTRPPVSRGVELARIAESLVGQTVMGRFRIDATLGHGSTGIVFRAHDAHSGSLVAMKFLDPELSKDRAVVERFRSEALTPSLVATSHVVKVLEADVCPELVAIARPDDPMSAPIPYLVMELLEGRDLRQHVVEQGPLPFEDVGSWLWQIAQTLDLAHGLGIVHRDLKPANLFLAILPGGQTLVKVLDFGIAQMADATASRGLAGGLHGTPLYMSPEQAEGIVATAASDRWALGLIAFRLLTGESYWMDCPIAELLGHIMEGPQVPPSWVIRERKLSPRGTLGSAFDMWFMRACHIDPRQRFSTVTEQMKQLRVALQSTR